MIWFCQKFVVLALALFFSLMVSQSAQAIGIGVKPNELSFKALVNFSTETEVLIFNVSSEPALYQVYPDGLNSEIKISPADFRLDPDGSQLIKVIVNPKRPGIFSTNLSVVARPLASGGLAAATGVKIPLTLYVWGLPLWAEILAGIIVCLFAFFAVKLLISRNKIKAN
ncbi:MAG: hypothetical protein WC768_04610 [Patescibacteria group bacterium]|jgi:hypothetical protein